MQAITAIRLLLHSGQLQRVLLVCPKPLVTNWQREFALWAPEVPLIAIEGDQAKRPLAVATARRSGENRQLRTAQPRSATSRRSRDAVRSGRARRIATDQEPQRHDQPGGAIDFSQPKLGTDRHAGGKQPGRSGRHFRIRRPGAYHVRHEAAQHGPGGERICAAADERQSAQRSAAQIIPRRRIGADARAAAFVYDGRGRRRVAADRDGAVGDDPACVRVDFAAEADLQFRPRHVRERQVRTAVGRFGRSRRQRQEGDRVQPMGRNADDARPAAAAIRRVGISRPNSAEETGRRDPRIPRRPEAGTCC